MRFIRVYEDAATQLAGIPVIAGKRWEPAGMCRLTAQRTFRPCYLSHIGFAC